MLALALPLLLAVEPTIGRPDAVLSVTLVPLSGGLTATKVKEALDSFGDKEGRFAKGRPIKRADVPGLGVEALPYTTKGLPADVRAKLAKVEQAIAIEASWPRDDATALRDIYHLLTVVAEQNVAVIYDQNAATALTAADWRARRLTAGWADGVADGAMHVQVHLVLQPSGLVMLDTGGMPRFAVEDFELLDVNRSSVDVAGELVNVVAQRLIEGARPDAKGRLLVRFDDLKSKRLRERVKQRDLGNAKGQLVVGFTRADITHGAREDTLELTFPDCKGKDRGERFDCAAKALFGSKDATAVVDHSDEKVTAAKAKAKAALKAYEAKVKKGLPEGDVLLVKAPFEYAGGREWMWVDVATWSAGKIKGRLENEPEYATGLKAGQTVEVKADQVMDYMYKSSDGTFFGNEVGRAMYPEMFEELGGGRARVRE